MAEETRREERRDRDRERKRERERERERGGREKTEFLRKSFSCLERETLAHIRAFLAKMERDGDGEWLRAK
jgi:hypothetical protein